MDNPKLKMSGEVSIASAQGFILKFNYNLKDRNSVRLDVFDETLDDSVVDFQPDEIHSFDRKAFAKWIRLIYPLIIGRGIDDAIKDS